MTMVDDFKDYADLNGGATAASIRTSADSPRTHTSTIQSIVDDLADDSQQIRANVEGDIQDATLMNLNPANTAARRLTQSGLFAVGLLNSFADTVETFDTEVKAINTLLHDNTYARWQAQKALPSGDDWQPDSGSKSDNSEAGSAGDSPDLSYAEIKQQEKAKLKGRYDKAHTTLEDEADRVAALFEGSPDLSDVKALVLAGYIPLQLAGIWPNLKLTTEERTQAQLATVKRMTPAEQVEYVKTHKDIDKDIAAVISPAAQETLAREVAEAIKEKGTVSRDTVDVMLLFSGQQAFSHELFSKVTPRQFAAEIADFNNDLFPQPAPNSGAPSDEDVVLYRDFINASGLALATYSQADGPYKPPGDLADKWFEAITDDDHNQDASALTLLVKAGGHQSAYDPDFISELTGRVYEWEKGHDGAVWGPRDSDVIYDPNDPPKYQPIYDRSGTQHGQWVDGTRATDGLANLLGGMEHSPEGAQDFFHGRYEGSSQNLDQRMDYLLGGSDARTWDVADKSDDGDGLGLALQAATVGEDSRTADGTEIANKLFENIAKYGGKADGWATSEWHIGPNMTDSLGAIAAGYTGDIYHELAGYGATHGSTHLDLGENSGDTLKRVLGELGRPDDKGGLETLTAAMMLQGKSEITDQLSHVHGPHTIDNLMDAGLEGTQQRNGKVMGLLLNEGLSLAADEDKSDEQRAAILSKAIDVTAGFIPGAGGLLGDGAHELTKMTVDTMKSEAIDALKSGVAAAPDTDSYVDANAMSIDQKIQTNAIDSLVQQGYLNPQNTEKYGHWEGMPKNVLVGDHVDPRLYDADGHNIDTSKMTANEKHDVEKMQDAWTRYNESDPSSQVLTITGQSEFMKYFTDPTLTYDK